MSCYSGTIFSMKAKEKLSAVLELSRDLSNRTCKTVPYIRTVRPTSAPTCITAWYPVVTRKNKSYTWMHTKIPPLTYPHESSYVKIACTATMAAPGTHTCVFLFPVLQQLANKLENVLSRETS